MSPAPEHALWDFSQDLYGCPGVAEACLSLQDRRGLDVNILLFCCWAGMRGQALAVEALTACLDTVRPWQDQVVKPLRAVRRWLKGQRTAPAGVAEALRQAIKAQELEAERLEQLVLAAAETRVTEQGCPACAAANLGTYFSALDVVPGDRDRADLATLLCGLVDGLHRDEARALLA